jgi:hypothetical protein
MLMLPCSHRPVVSSTGVLSSTGGLSDFADVLCTVYPTLGCLRESGDRDDDLARRVAAEI